jgi:hypothetical protein
MLNAIGRSLWVSGRGGSCTACLGTRKRLAWRTQAQSVDPLDDIIRLPLHFNTETRPESLVLNRAIIPSFPIACIFAGTL